MHVFARMAILAMEPYVSLTREQDEDATKNVLHTVFVFPGWKRRNIERLIKVKYYLGMFKVTVVFVTRDIETKAGSVSKPAQDAPGQSLKSLQIWSSQQRFCDFKTGSVYILTKSQKNHSLLRGSPETALQLS